MSVTLESLQDEMRDFLPHCVEQRSNGRIYPTAEGCKLLQDWLRERGLEAKVSIGPDQRFRIE